MGEGNPNSSDSEHKNTGSVVAQEFLGLQQEVFAFVGLSVNLRTRFRSKEAMDSFRTYRMLKKYDEELLNFLEHSV